MRHFIYFLTICLLSVTQLHAETFVMANQSGLPSTNGDFTITFGSYTMACMGNNGATKPVYNTIYQDVRLYAKNAVQFTTTGNAMKQIVFNISAQGKKRQAEITASTGSVLIDTTAWTVTWTGSSKNVTFTVGDKATYGTDGATKAGQFAFLSIEIATGDLATGISLNKSSTTLKVGDSETLTATITPSNATNKSVTWQSSDTSVATVNNEGDVTAVGVGSATITAMTADGSNLSASCAVTVEDDEPPVTSDDRLYIPDITIGAGETQTVEIMLDNSVAYTALQADIYLPEGLTVEQEDGEYIFDLTDRKARNHTISSSTLSSGAIRILIASQTLKEISGTSGALVTFNLIADASFSGQKVIQIKNVVATEPDRTEHVLPDTVCTVTAKGGNVEPPTQGVTLNTIMTRLELGQTIQLENLDGADVTWTSSNPAVANVDANGVVTALTSGMAAITATDAQGHSAWCAVWSYLRGDVNEDGVVNVMDVSTDIDIILDK